MKKILFTFLAIVLLFASSTTSALTQTERDALIQTLLQQIAVLQNQINAILSARGDGVANQSLAAAPQLTRNLYLGSRGDDVVSTQRFLQSTGDFTYGEITGYYGNATAEAVQRYQCRAMSICSGTQDGNGYGVVGPATRSSFMMKYSTPSTTITVPVLSPVVPHVPVLLLSLIQS
jgi:peptidoglycan hydrolase-like protein with peptidoglycan-binding domain